MATKSPATTDADRYRDEVSGATILRGELIAWSDGSLVSEPTAIREVVRSIVAARSLRRVLLAGPRAALLVGAIPDDVPVDVLLRSLPDTRRAGDAAGLHERSRLFSGGLDSFTPDHDYDLVVALGGPGRLLGPDSVGLSHADVVARLAQPLSDDGILLLDVANGLALTDLVAADPVVPNDSDDLWHVGAAGFDARAPYRAELPALLDGSGLTTARTYAVLPDLDHSSMLVDVAACSTDAPTATTARVRSHAITTVARRLSGSAMLRDPRVVIEQVIDAGALETLAPAWLLVTAKGDAAFDGLPLLVDAEDGVEPRWARVVSIADDGTSSVTWADGHTDPETSEGKLSRDLVAPSPVDGRFLDMVLREACAVRQHIRIRDVVRRYNEWLHATAAHPAAQSDRRFSATLDNILVRPDGTFEIFDRSWRRQGIVSGDHMLILGLRRFARTLLASAAPHPWRTDSTPDSLTYTLTAMVGVVPKPEDIERLAIVEAELDLLRTGSDEDLADAAQDNLEQGQITRGLPAATATGFREMLMYDRAQSRRMRERDGQVAWLEGTLRHRDRYIRELEKLIDGFEATLTYKTVQAVRAPRRIATEKAVSTAKTTVKDALPPDFMNKARRLARKALNPPQSK